jgi:hypothetical protein
MSRTDSTIRRRLALAAAALVLASCGGDDPKPGSIRFALTDAAGCGFDQVNVTVDRIRVHRSADAAATAAGWSELRLQPARRIDLLQLTNGVLVELGSLSVPASRFANLRLVLAANGSGTPANSVVADGVETALTLPADATASGIRVATQVTVEANRVSDLLLDFDACRSVVPSGATYLLQPVVTAVPRHGAVISGYVPTQMAGARVSAQKNGLPQRSTVADGNGRFVLAFLDPAQSPFDVVVVAAGRAAAVVAAVPITSTVGAELSRPEAPIAPPTATDRSVSGALGPAAARESGAIRAVQAIGTTTQAEVGYTRVDAASGSYAIDLPAAQPRLASYSTRLPLVFNATGISGRYTMTASAEGFETQLLPVDVAAGSLTWSPSLLVP